MKAMKKWTPAVGDFVVTYGLGKGIIVSIGPYNDGRKAYLVKLGNGREEWVWPIAMRKATFIEYCTWPTGFGKTPWPQFWLGVVAVGIGLLCFAFDKIPVGGAVFLVAFSAYYLFATFGNWKRWWV